MSATAIATPSYPPRHYPTAAAKCADLIVHLLGLAFAIICGSALLFLSVRSGKAGEIAAVSVYTVGLVAMLAISTAYNFAKNTARPLLRRFDHAGIFLMIAASYTPFTTQSLTGAWAWSMTIAVWSVAAFGVFGKLFLPGLGKKLWVAVYVALGWLALFAIEPLFRGVHNWVAMLLLGIGGLLYTTGVLFYLNKSLKFSRAIWHGHVVAAAGVHWTAVLLGVVLTAK